MPSPFPGMDPYLQHPGHWLDFHNRFIVHWCEAIADRLPDEYEANIGEHVYLIEEDPDARKLIIPDMALSQDETPLRRAHGLSGGAVALEPVTIPLIVVEGMREAYVEILYGPERSLVTVLELLSPTNKQSSGREDYLLKRNAILKQQVHLVELDLLKEGLRPPLRKPWPAGDCGYLVSKHENRPDAQIYTWSIRQPLPTLPIPLRGPDPDITTDLAAVFTTAYDRGRFAKRVRYQGDCPIDLSEDDRLWARQIVETRSGR